MSVLTIGHSTRSVDELLELLERAGVQVLVDVRRYPGSRRHPQFSREALAAVLSGAGLEYRHEPRLGGRRNPVPGSPNVSWRSASFRGYADHTATAEFKVALQGVIDAARERVVAVMCAEAVPWRCHRQLIADALVARGIPVEHILGPGPRKPHELNPAAQPTPDGHLVYGAPPPEEPQKRLF
jgi:uncharacterized protein (DUF488 family)